MNRYTTYAVAVSLLLASHVGLSADSARPQKHITSEQAIACIKLAVAAKAGSVTELDVKIENNRTICEVEVIDAKGKKYEVYVDVAANKVARVEE